MAISNGHPILERHETYKAYNNYGFILSNGFCNIPFKPSGVGILLAIITFQWLQFCREETNLLFGMVMNTTLQNSYREKFAVWTSLYHNFSLSMTYIYINATNGFNGSTKEPNKHDKWNPHTEGALVSTHFFFKIMFWCFKVIVCLLSAAFSSDFERSQLDHWDLGTCATGATGAKWKQHGFVSTMTFLSIFFV